MDATVCNLSNEDVGKTISLHLPGGTFTGELTGVRRGNDDTVVMEFSDKRVIAYKSMPFTEVEALNGV